jgi:hypothetical protein
MKPNCFFENRLKEWRNATVTAIFKKGNNSMPGNYRPVNLISGM